MNYLNIQNEKLEPVARELNTLLADYHLYYQKLRNFHWNVRGRSFFDLHEKFESLYGDAREKIDAVAERILTLRFRPMSTFSAYLEASSLDESESTLEDVDMVSEILKAHGIILRQMSAVARTADEAGDEGTVDLIGAYIREMEKSSWMLEAWRNAAREHIQPAG